MILNISLAIAAGIMTWSFSEYALHNWYGHVPKGKNKFSKEHLTHHAKKDYFASPAEKAKMAVPILGFSAAATIPFFGVAVGISYSLTFGMTYLAYEFFHRLCHTHAPKTRLGAFLRKHHFYHHFGNPWKNHGVTSAIWDRVFNTFVKPDTIQVPQKFAMDWLIDESGEVKPQFQKDYAIIQYSKKLPEQNTLTPVTNMI